jgi:DNA modification methylase
VKVLDTKSSDKYTIYNADTVEVARELPSESVDFSIFSPPFASLYTYSNSDRDWETSKAMRSFGIIIAT